MIACSRCGAEVAHVTAILQHWQDSHGGVPRPYVHGEAPAHTVRRYDSSERKAALRTIIAGRKPSPDEVAQLAAEYGYRPRTVERYGQLWRRGIL